MKRKNQEQETISLNLDDLKEMIIDVLVSHTPVYKELEGSDIRRMFTEKLVMGKDPWKDINLTLWNLQAKRSKDSDGTIITITMEKTAVIPTGGSDETNKPKKVAKTENVSTSRLCPINKTPLGDGYGSLDECDNCELSRECKDEALALAEEREEIEKTVDSNKCPITGKPLGATDTKTMRECKACKLLDECKAQAYDGDDDEEANVLAQEDEEVVDENK